MASVQGAGLTTPHKLQAEARLGKLARAGRVAWGRRKLIAAACLLHAVVSLRWRSTVGSAPLRRVDLVDDLPTSLEANERDVVRVAGTRIVLDYLH